MKFSGTLFFLEGYQNLFFIGGTGAGKSFLAQAIGNESCASGFETLFISVNHLFREVEMAEAQGNYLTYLSRLSKVRLLILDDFGLRNYSHKEAIIDSHYEEKHSESISDEIIVNLVNTLDGQNYEPDDEKPPYSYFVTDNI